MVEEGRAGAEEKAGFRSLPLPCFLHGSTRATQPLPPWSWLSQDVAAVPSASFLCPFNSRATGSLPMLLIWGLSHLPTLASQKPLVGPVPCVKLPLVERPGGVFVLLTGP